MGGLHTFMGWDSPILSRPATASGVFSLSKLREIRDDGVRVPIHIDGTRLFLGQKEVMGIEPTSAQTWRWSLTNARPGRSTATPAPWPAPAAALGPATGRSRPRADSWPPGHLVFAIAQDPRTMISGGAAGSLSDLDFSGYAVGGVSVRRARGRDAEAGGRPRPSCGRESRATRWAWERPADPAA